jgi:hypothetical protein
VLTVPTAYLPAWLAGWLAACLSGYLAVVCIREHLAGDAVSTALHIYDY